MVFLWDEPKRQPSSIVPVVKCCRKGHDLYWDTVASRCGSEQRLACDVCGKHICHPYRTAVCAKCNFDLCAKCYEKWEEPDKPRQAPANILSFFLPSCTPVLTDTTTVVTTSSVQREGNAMEFTSSDRYNKVRPKYGSNRVSYLQFPDPTDYGWLFTGSSRKQQVAFYERVVEGCFVKLDFHYTSGSIRTMLERPSMESTVLFQARGSEIPALVYKEVLRNPLSQAPGDFHVSDDEDEDDSIRDAIDDDESIYQLDDKITWSRMH